MSTQIKNVLKTDSKAYGVSRINIHYRSPCKVVHCRTKHFLLSLNISWWPAGTCCHLHGTEEKAGGTFPSPRVRSLAQNSELLMLRCSYALHTAQGKLLPLWWHFLWTSARGEKWPFLRTGVQMFCAPCCASSPAAKRSAPAGPSALARLQQRWVNWACWRAWSRPGTHLRSSPR